MEGSFWPGLIGAVVGGLFTLGGATLAHWLQARHDRNLTQVHEQLAVHIDVSEWWRTTKPKFQQAEAELKRLAATIDHDFPLFDQIDIKYAENVLRQVDDLLKSLPELIRTHPIRHDTHSYHHLEADEAKHDGDVVEACHGAPRL
jgi:hypothetical protein